MNRPPSIEFDPAAIFADLKSLVGHWRGVNEAGDPVEVNYRLTANDSALVEDWIFANGGTALTVFHKDHDILMARHYCPIGNQPRLDLTRVNSEGRLYFSCVSCTHLVHETAPHNHAFDMRLIDPKRFHRSEVYYEEDGLLSENSTVFKRG